MYFHCRDSVHVSAELQAGGGGGDDGVQVPGGGGEDVGAGHQVVPGLQPLPLAGPPAPPLEGGPAAGGHQTHRPRVSGQSTLSTLTTFKHTEVILLAPIKSISMGKTKFLLDIC